MLGCFAASAAAAPTDALPATGIVQQALLADPSVEAASSRLSAAEAQRQRLESGSNEFNLRAGVATRKVNATGSSSAENFGEWNLALEHPWRLPGKAQTDARLGQAHLDWARSAKGDALHETSRALLKAWFAWLRESAALTLWQRQEATLKEQTQSVRRRHALGDAAQIESLQAQAALAQVQAQLTQARLREQTAAETLRRRWPTLSLNAPATLPEPRAPEGTPTLWLERITQENHEMLLARHSARIALLQSERQRQDHLPDPNFGLSYSHERGGQESVLGAYVSFALPGQARRSALLAAEFTAQAASRDESAIARRIAAEAAVLYQTALVSREAWQAQQQAAQRLGESANMVRRAYELGEGSASDWLSAHRLATEAQLWAQSAQIDALESHCRLLLDAHMIWEFD